MDDAKNLLEAFEPKEVKLLQKSAGREFTSVRFSPCGKFLVGAGFDAKIARWNITGDEPQEAPALAGHNGWIADVAFDPAGQFIYSADTWGQLRCTPLAEENLQPKWQIAAAHDGWIQSLAISADGKLLATGGNDRQVRVWSADDGRKLHEFDKHADPVLRVAFHPDGKSLVSGDLKGIVRQFDATAGTSVRQFDAGVLFKLDRLQDTGGVRSLAFNTEGTLLAVGGTKPSVGGNVQGIPVVLVFDWATGAIKPTLELGQPGDVYVTDVRFHPAGFLMCTISGNPGVGKLVYRRLEDAASFYSNTGMANLHSLSLHPNQTRLAVSGTNAGSNGNGRLLKDGEYPANWSPIWILDMPSSVPGS
jgi:hypothetical protein